jgi:hypothetical protein
MNQANITETGPRPKRAERGTNLDAPRLVHNRSALKTDDQGRYDMILSPSRPDDYTDDWRPIDPTSNGLMVRLVGSDWARKWNYLFSSSGSTLRPPGRAQPPPC